MPEVAGFPKVLCTSLEAVGVRLYFLPPSEWLRDFCARLILRVDAKIISRTEAGWLNAKQAKIPGKQVYQIESKYFLISPNISKKLITLMPRELLLEKQPGLFQPEGNRAALLTASPPLSIQLSIGQKGAEAACGVLAAPVGSVPACSYFSPEPISLLNLKFNPLHLSPLPHKVVMRN